MSSSGTGFLKVSGDIYFTVQKIETFLYFVSGIFLMGFCRSCVFIGRCGAGFRILSEFSDTVKRLECKAGLVRRVVTVNSARRL